MLRRATEEVGSRRNSCLTFSIYLNVMGRRALFSNDPEPFGFDSLLVEKRQPKLNTIFGTGDLKSLNQKND